ncbi:MAG TPA: HD domain-containing protein [Byssovorax sp.]|jgi:predicted HD phosphohydrolase
MYDDLRDLLAALDGVRQSPKYHPEGDALYHSLQAFDLARRATDDRALWAAALVHDVGKAHGSADHDATGADLLDGIVAPRIVWLVRHHLDLLDAPGATKRRLRGERALVDLQRLRAWDVGGRKPGARVPTLDDALALLLEKETSTLTADGGEPAPFDDDAEGR